jgi:hypothetical protein
VLLAAAAAANVPAHTDRGSIGAPVPLCRGAGGREGRAVVPDSHTHDPLPIAQCPPWQRRAPTPSCRRRGCGPTAPPTVRRPAAGTAATRPHPPLAPRRPRSCHLACATHPPRPTPYHGAR